jgi:esterase
MILSSTVYPATTATDALPLVILHGLFGSARNWSSLAKTLSERSDVITLSLRNHGDSPHKSDVTYPAMAQDVAETLVDLGLQSVDLLGHSMGGKVAMTLALTRPDIVNRLIVVDIAPKAYSADHNKYIEAMKAVPLDRITRRSEADVYLKDSIPEPALRAFILQNLTFSDGQGSWILNLDALLEGMTDIEGFPQFKTSFDKSTLFLHGEASDYVKEADKKSIQTLFHDADIIPIPDAGHWPHAEKPAVFTQMLTDWLG